MPMHGERVPVENSRLSGFFKLSVDDRRKLVQKLSGISDEQVEALANNGELSDEAADINSFIQLVGNDRTQTAIGAYLQALANKRKK